MWCGLGGSASAEIPKLGPKLDKESLISVHEFNGTEIVKYATNGDFFEVKAKIHRMLGKEWAEVPLPKSTKKKDGAFAVEDGANRPKILGEVRFENLKHKGVFIHLALMKKPVKEKEHTAVISTVRRR